MEKIVIKIGRSIATSKRNKIDRYRFEQLAKQISQLQERDVSVVLVVSAAVCCGEKELGSDSLDLSKSLIAGVGQATVMATLYNIFTKHDLTIGQLLITKSDLEDKHKRITIKKIISQALKRHIILIINENDAVELHSFAGNDYLATEIAKLTQADHLLLLTDVEGVFNENMQLIHEYSNAEALAQIIKLNHKGEVGGMLGKIDAAIDAAIHGIPTWIASGHTQDILTRMFLQNEHIGTRVLGGAL